VPNEYTLSFRTVSAYGAATLPLDLLSILLISLLLISAAHATKHHYSINCPSSLAHETIPTTTLTSFAISRHQPCNARYVPTRLLRIYRLPVNTLSPVPLALAAPAAAAGLAYLNARTSFSYDYRMFGSAFSAQIRCAIREKKDRLNLFYVLEDYANGKLADHALLIYNGRQWTYKEVYEIALKYGTWLKTRYKVKSKEIVAMDFMNGEKFIFIWLGLWSIGAKPAFINYNLTGKALAHCVKVSMTRLILVDPEIQHNVTKDVRDDLPDVQFVLFSPEIEAEAMSTDGVREPDSCRTETKSQNMAMLIYTSGTTGLPKGAIVSWTKTLVGSLLVRSWMSFRRSDIFYTVCCHLS
jgi:hypothetical protein